MIEQLFLYGNNYVWWMGLVGLFQHYLVRHVHREYSLMRLRATDGDYYSRFLHSFMYYLSWSRDFSIFPIKPVLIAQLYLMMGELAQRHRLIGLIANRGLWFSAGILLIMVGVCVYAGKIAGIPMEWPSCRFTHLLYMLTILACDTFCLL